MVVFTEWTAALLTGINDLYDGWTATSEAESALVIH